MTSETTAIQRHDPPTAAGEVETLLGYLAYQRDTIRRKVAGFDRTGLAQTLPPSSMTLGGMLKHLALVEDWWTSCVLLGEEYAPEFRDVDWDADEDWDWHSAVHDSPERLREMFDAFVGRSDTNIARVLPEGGLDTLSVGTVRGGQHASLRWIVCHLIEEYARHVGHADLIRESIDGSTGE